MPTLIILITLFTLAAYLAAYIPAIGMLYVFVFGKFLGKIFGRVEKLLAPLSYSNLEQTKHPGLRTTILLIALVLSLAALSAEMGGSLQALAALGFAAPSLPTVVNAAIGVLFVSVSCLWGMVYLETKHAVPDEAKIFAIPEKHQTSFARFTKYTFVLSVVASVSYYVLRAAFLADSQSNLTHLVQVTTFILVGILTCLTGVIALFLIALALAAIIRLLFTIPWFVFSLLSGVCQELATHFEGLAKTWERKRMQQTGSYPYAGSQPARDWQRQPSLTSFPAPSRVETDKTKWPTGPLPSLTNLLSTEDESSHTSVPGSSGSDLSGSSLVEVAPELSEAGLNGNGKKKLIEPATWPVLVASAPGEATDLPVQQGEGDLDAPYEITLPDRQPFTLTPRNLEVLLQEVFSELDASIPA